MCEEQRKVKMPGFYAIPRSVHFLFLTWWKFFTLNYICLDWWVIEYCLPWSKDKCTPIYKAKTHKSLLGAWGEPVHKWSVGEGLMLLAGQFNKKRKRLTYISGRGQSSVWAMEGGCARSVGRRGYGGSFGGSNDYEKRGISANGQD